MANYIAVENKLNDTKRRNLFTFIFIQDFIWMCFYFTLVFFFMIKLESLILVGLFLGFGNLVSFFSDSPIGVLQKYFKPKSMFIAGSFMMLIVALIFLYFMFQTNSIELKDVDAVFSAEAISWLFSSALNISLLLIVVVLYGILTEVQDVTMLSYIMNNSDPSGYADLFSKNKIFSGFGSLGGLLTSGVILALNTFVAVIILIIFISLFILFIIKFFDNAEEKLEFGNIKKIKLLTKDEIFESVRNYKTQILDNKSELLEKTKNLKVIFLKPIEIKNQIDFKDLFKSTVNELKDFMQIMFRPPYNYKLLIIGGIFVMFGFWDTFVTTFLIDYIDTILASSRQELAKFGIQNLFTAYVAIALFSAPAYGGQVPLVGLAGKFGVWKVMIPGLFVAGISMFIFGLTGSISIILLAGVINGLGYAACMPTSQGEFSNEYNITYAGKNNLKQIDSNASAAPTKMLANLANVIGLALGGFILQIFGYTGTFFFLGFILFGLFFVSVFKGKKFKLY